MQIDKKVILDRHYEMDAGLRIQKSILEVLIDIRDSLNFTGDTLGHQNQELRYLIEAVNRRPNF